MRRTTGTISIGMSLLLATPLLLDAQPPDNSSEEQAIRAMSQSYRDAFNQGDAKAIAALWAEPGELLDQFGYLLEGREAIEKSFRRFFARHSDAKLKLEIRSIKFPSTDVAVETGFSEINGANDKGPLIAYYSATYVKEDGKWQLLRIHEAPPPPPSNYEQLKPLEWLVGNWIDEEVQPDNEHTKAVVHISCKWSVNRNFIIREFTATVDDQVTTTGTQTIGWDAVSKRVRSWTFDSKGGIIMGVWEKEGDDWVVRTEEHLRTGQKVLSTEIVTQQGPDKHTWRVTNRSVGDKKLPDLVVNTRRQK